MCAVMVLLPTIPQTIFSEWGMVSFSFLKLYRKLFGTAFCKMKISTCHNPGQKPNTDFLWLQLYCSCYFPLIFPNI